MKSYFEGFEQEDAELIESLSRASYEMRENRKHILEQYGVSDEKSILAQIASGEIPEHPAYEHYLSVSILVDMQEIVRTELARVLQEVKAV